MRTTRRLILASTSPRRKLLLRQIGLEFEIRENGVKETIDESKSPEENVLHLSRSKAMAVAKSVGDGIVVGVDTLVVLGDRLLGKPKDARDAVSMLKMLSGREHRVVSGFTFVDQPSGRVFSDIERTTVKFRELENEEILQYVASGSPLDKAGSYGIQDDFGAVFVEYINGCFYNVMGLPLTKFYVSLNNFLGENSWIRKSGS